MATSYQKYGNYESGHDADDEAEQAVGQQTVGYLLHRADEEYWKRKEERVKELKKSDGENYGINYENIDFKTFLSIINHGEFPSSSDQKKPAPRQLNIAEIKVLTELFRSYYEICQSEITNQEKAHKEFLLVFELIFSGQTNNFFVKTQARKMRDTLKIEIPARKNYAKK